MSEFMSKLLSSLLPVLLTAFLAWIGNRKDQARRKQIFEEAKQRIELINAYVASQKLVIEDAAELGVVKKTAANELYDIKAFLDNKLQSMEKVAEKSENYLQRFFLIYKMKTWAASFFRACFFMALFVSVIWSIYISSKILQDTYKYEVATPIILIIVFTVPPVLAVLLFRWLATKLDKPKNSTEITEVIQHN